MSRIIMLLAVLVITLPVFAQVAEDTNASDTKNEAEKVLVAEETADTDEPDPNVDTRFAEEAEEELDESKVDDLDVDDDAEREKVRERLEQKRRKNVPSRYVLNQETLLSGKIAHGGFGGPVVKGTYMDEEYELLIGGRLGYIIDHKFCIGLGGYGMVTNHVVREHAVSDSTIQIYMGYGGLDLEYRFNPKDLVNFSVTTLVGAGGASLKYHDPDKDWDDDDDDDDDDDIDSDAFFVLEPGVNVMVNVARYFKCGIGASYRYINGVEFDTSLVDIDDKDLSGFSIMLNFEGGFF